MVLQSPSTVQVGTFGTSNPLKLEPHTPTPNAECAKTKYDPKKVKFIS